MTRQMTQVQSLDDYTFHPDILQKVKPLVERIRTKRYHACFISHHNQQITEVGISWTNAMHPTAKYTQVVSLHSGQEMVHRLQSLGAPFTKVIASCSSEAAKEIDRLEQAGFTLFRKTYEETFAIASVLPVMADRPLDVKLVSLAEVLNEPDFEKELFTLVKRNYEQTHLANEAADVPWTEWKDLLMKDDPDLMGSLVAIEGETVVGYIFLHPITETHCEVGWMGTRGEGDIETILKVQLQDLLCRGFQTIGVEIDTTDHFAYQLAELFKLDGLPSWNSYKWETNNIIKEEKDVKEWKHSQS